MNNGIKFVATVGHALIPLVALPVNVVLATNLTRQREIAEVGCLKDKEFLSLASNTVDLRSHLL